jgi:citronellol/citronellal dehydrogenase
MDTLEGKVALVTGASRGVGAAISVALAANGARVACVARSTASHPSRLTGTLDATVERILAIGGTAIAVPADLSRPEDVGEMVARTRAEFGPVDILVNNAGVTFVGGLDVSLKRHDLVMDINLRAPLLAMRAVIPDMIAIGGGHIVNISSAAALNVFPGMMSYGMSKAALERMSVDVAEQLRSENIAVNCFRIDVAVASEGFMSNAPGQAFDDWEPCEVPAEGVVWILSQPTSFTGQLLSMQEMRHEHGIMPTRTRSPFHPYEGQLTNWSIGVPTIA